MPESLKVVILTGQDSPLTCSIVSTLAHLPEAQVAGIMIDSGRVSVKARLRKLRRNVRRQGWSYLWFRWCGAITDWLERLAAGVVPKSEVSTLFAAAFPGQALTLDQLGMLHRIPVFRVDNLNSAIAAEILRRLTPDLGVVIGTRILKRSTFSVPRIGCLNLHLGKVPQYRGMPPGFWELYDGYLSAGVTVHLVDDGLDTGDIVAEETLSVHDRDTPETLKRRLEARGREVLVQSVVALAHGVVTPKAQPAGRWPVRTAPTRRERKELARRLPAMRERQAIWMHALKTAYYLLLYYAGLPSLFRTVRRIRGKSRACILLYHRVNDLADDPLTTDVRRFAEHMMVLRKSYAMVPSSVLVAKVCGGQMFQTNAVTIHFDDCYRDVFVNARPVLGALAAPATLFVSSGYVGTQRRFPHDESGPWIFENLHPEEVRELIACGFEVGSHTVNHVDLGQVSDDTAATELTQSKRDLEAMTGRPVTLFSFPFGRETNIRPGVTALVRQAGYRAMFSAHGGYVTRASDPFDLPRVGASGDTRPLDLIMEIEGLSLGALRRRWRRAWWFCQKPSAPRSPERTPSPQPDDARLIREEEMT